LGFGDAHGGLDVRGLLFSSHAGGPRRAFEAVLVEEDEEASGLAIIKAEVGDVVGSVFEGAVLGDGGVAF